MAVVNDIQGTPDHAESLNPLVGESAEETLSNAVAVLAFLQDAHVLSQTDGGTPGGKVKRGEYLILSMLIDALATQEELLSQQRTAA